MTKQDKQFLDDCMYFHLNKGDMGQYASFDEKRLNKLDPFLYELRFKAILANNMLDTYVKNKYNEN